MRFPDRIRIGPFEVDIKYRRKPSANRRLCYGTWNQEKLRIEMSTRKQTQQHARETLLHETLHAISDVYGANLEEEQVEQLSKGLADTLLTNGDFTSLFLQDNLPAWVTVDWEKRDADAASADAD